MDTGRVGTGRAAPPGTPDPKKEELVDVFQMLVCPRDSCPTSDMESPV